MVESSVEVEDTHAGLGLYKVSRQKTYGEVQGEGIRFHDQSAMYILTRLTTVTLAEGHGMHLDNVVVGCDIQLSRSSSWCTSSN